MTENYIMLNGKRVDLTDEQIKKLGLKTKSDCFEREVDGLYYFISGTGEIITTDDIRHKSDEALYSVANYCTDHSLIKQRALHEILSRLLWRFSMQNNMDKIDWGNVNSSKYYIYYKHNEYSCNIDRNTTFQNEGSVYFYSREIANRAINEIILPFMKEHPEFVW